LYQKHGPGEFENLQNLTLLVPESEQWTF